MNILMSGVHYGSAFEPGGSGLPYYCTPPVCVSTVLDALECGGFKPKKKKKFHILFK